MPLATVPSVYTRTKRPELLARGERSPPKPRPISDALFHAVALTLENLKLNAVRLLVPPITRAENVGRGGYPQSIRVLVTFSVDFLGHETRLELLRELVPGKAGEYPRGRVAVPRS